MPPYIPSRNLITLEMKENVVKLNFPVINHQRAIGQENDDIILFYRLIGWPAKKQQYAARATHHTA